MLARGNAVVTAGSSVLCAKTQEGGLLALFNALAGWCHGR